jgi:hypothetical protein
VEKIFILLFIALPKFQLFGLLPDTLGKYLGKFKHQSTNAVEILNF